MSAVGCALYVRQGNDCALIKNWHQGYRLTYWVQKLNLASFSSPEEVCHVFIDSQCKDYFDFLLIKRKVILKFECARRSNPIDDLSAMMEVSDDYMSSDECFWHDYFTCDDTGHLWYIDLDAKNAMKNESPPMVPRQLCLVEFSGLGNRNRTIGE